MGGDPLEDPRWQKHRRTYRTTTVVFAGLSAGLLLSSGILVLARPYDGCSDCSSYGDIPPSPRDHRYDRAQIGLGVVTAFSVLGLLLSASIYGRHLERAVPTRYWPAPILRSSTDPRADPAWRMRDRRLTRGIRGTAAVAGITGVAASIMLSAPFRGYEIPLSLTGALPAAALSLVNLIALAALAGARRQHRLQIAAWPRLGAGGLTMRF